MRQGQQNRRGRGRSNNNNNNNSNNNNNRKSQNPLTRSFESTGPDVKVRGTPSHVAEKYISLARDALSSGDRVLAEPPARGLNWLVYLLPPLAFLVGIFILYRAFRSWKQPTAERITAEAVEHAPDASQTVRDDDYIARIEEGLKNR